MDNDKKIVNTEEENRAVNPSGNSANPEDSISQEAAHTVDTEISSTSRDIDESNRKTSADSFDDTKRETPDRVEGDEVDPDRSISK